MAWITYSYVWQRFERYYSHHRAKWIFPPLYIVLTLFIIGLKIVQILLDHFISNVALYHIQFYFFMQKTLK